MFHACWLRNEFRMKEMDLAYAEQLDIRTHKEQIQEQSDSDQ